MIPAVQTAAQKRAASGIGSNSRHADAPLCACAECGREFVQTQATRLFCADPCKQAFNNRRQKRGAEAYDLIMAWRFERPLARALGLFPLLCKLASGWRGEDREQRQGRPSWIAPRTTAQRLTRYRATRITEGKKR